MTNKISLIKAVFIATAALVSTQDFFASKILHFPMDVNSSGELTESVSGQRIKFYGVHNPENIAGAVGDALRLDGYSSYASGQLKSDGKESCDAMTFSLWAAPETYPIIKHDVPTSEKIVITGSLDEVAKKGWAFLIGSTGKYSFVCYSGGWRVEVEAKDVLPHYDWSHLVAVADGGSISLYRDGEKVGEARSLGTLDNSSSSFYIGKGPETNSVDGFNLNVFNGLVDEIEVFDEALDISSLQQKPENMADLSIPAQRFAEDLLRPRLHGMPGANWTNESHGMTYSDEKYHLFFQKNANGPFMSRLHWGHISSPDLINWTEEKIALFPDTQYDVKGCWSGCVFSDDLITGGKPNIIYTGVDYAKAYMALATPDDETLLNWTKSPMNPIINGRPAGLSDDFRDPYFFRNGDNAYLIVGTSKDGIGAVTLHKYIPLTGTWTNNAGDIFFSGSDKASCGTFWEMSNITPMGGKWLFTSTPQNTANGVRTLYWTGSINADGTFNADAASVSPRGVELISKDGYGLLSPTIYQKDGKTIALGIVPDKLPGNVNYNLGWAHCYSLPREWSLDSNGNLLQKPYEGLRAARVPGGFTKVGFTLEGTLELAPVAGRRFEVLGKFEVGNTPFGFNFFKDGTSEATLKYIPSANMLVVDFTKLNRTPNDNGSYNGMYSCVLPESIPAGSELTVDLFVDGSILDIFINDKWATSIRVFPTGANANGVEAFADSATNVKSLEAWTLKYDLSDLDAVQTVSNGPGNNMVNVIDINGTVLKRNVPVSEAYTGLQPGVYIIGDRKIMIR